MKIQGAIGNYNTIRDSFYNFAPSNHTVRLMVHLKKSNEIVHLGDHRKEANCKKIIVSGKNLTNGQRPESDPCRPTQACIIRIL